MFTFVSACVLWSSGSWSGWPFHLDTRFEKATIHHLPVRLALQTRAWCFVDSDRFVWLHVFDLILFDSDSRLPLQLCLLISLDLVFGHWLVPFDSNLALDPLICLPYDFVWLTIRSYSILAQPLCFLCWLDFVFDHWLQLASTE